MLTTGNSGMEFYGRFLKSQDGWQFDWSGSAIEAGFFGTEVRFLMRLIDGSDIDYFNVYIDGGDPMLLEVNNMSDHYVLAKGLDEGYHSVRIEKRTEGPRGALCEFLKFDFGDGTVASAPARKMRTIEFFGDSITAGYGNMTTGEQRGFRLIEEDIAHGYAALTAKHLNANALIVAWSGSGMYQELHGLKDPVFSNSHLWRTLAHKSDKDWAFMQEPDAVVINLGTNDFLSGCDTEQYSICYANFLRTVRKLYPHTHIVCTIGIIGAGYHAAHYIKSAITNSGIDNVSFLKMHVDLLPNGAGIWGADGHPSAAAHTQMAAQLTEHISARMDWKI